MGFLFMVDRLRTPRSRGVSPTLDIEALTPEEKSGRDARAPREFRD